MSNNFLDFLKTDCQGTGIAVSFCNVASRPYQWTVGGKTVSVENLTDSVPVTTAWQDFREGQVMRAVLKTVAIISLLIPSMLFTLCFKGAAYYFETRAVDVKLPEDESHETVSVKADDSVEESEDKSIQNADHEEHLEDSPYYKAWVELDGLRQHLASNIATQEMVEQYTELCRAFIEKVLEELTEEETATDDELIIALHKVQTIKAQGARQGFYNFLCKTCYEKFFSKESELTNALTELRERSQKVQQELMGEPEVDKSYYIGDGKPSEVVEFLSPSQSENIEPTEYTPFMTDGEKLPEGVELFSPGESGNIESAEYTPFTKAWGAVDAFKQYFDGILETLNIEEKEKLQQEYMDRCEGFVNELFVKVGKETIESDSEDELAVVLKELQGIWGTVVGSAGILDPDAHSSYQEACRNCYERFFGCEESKREETVAKLQTYSPIFQKEFGEISPKKLFSERKEY